MLAVRGEFGNDCISDPKQHRSGQNNPIPPVFFIEVTGRMDTATNIGIVLCRRQIVQGFDTMVTFRLVHAQQPGGLCLHLGLLLSQVPHNLC